MKQGMVPTEPACLTLEDNLSRNQRASCEVLKFRAGADITADWLFKSTSADDAAPGGTPYAPSRPSSDNVRRRSPGLSPMAHRPSPSRGETGRCDHSGQCAKSRGARFPRRP